MLFIKSYAITTILSEPIIIPKIRSKTTNNSLNII